MRGTRIPRQRPPVTAAARSDVTHESAHVEADAVVKMSLPSPRDGRTDSTRHGRAAAVKTFTRRGQDVCAKDPRPAGRTDARHQVGHAAPTTDTHGRPQGLRDPGGHRDIQVWLGPKTPPGGRRTSLRRHGSSGRLGDFFSNHFIFLISESFCWSRALGRRPVPTGRHGDITLCFQVSFLAWEVYANLPTLLFFIFILFILFILLFIFILFYFIIFLFLQTGFLFIVLAMVFSLIILIFIFNFIFIFWRKWLETLSTVVRHLGLVVRDSLRGATLWPRTVTATLQLLFFFVFFAFFKSFFLLFLKGVYLFYVSTL
uniref:Uncharacterized protein n=1 Tax=Mus spicilegus TaxID=10103 RepID=A0A8C6GJY2_MUSSI